MCYVCLGSMLSAIMQVWRRYIVWPENEKQRERAMEMGDGRREMGSSEVGGKRKRENLKIQSDSGVAVYIHLHWRIFLSNHSS